MRRAVAADGHRRRDRYLGDGRWEHYKAGIDLEAIAYREAQAEGPFEQGPFSQPLRRKTLGVRKLPTNQGVFCRLLCVGGANARLDGNGAGARAVMLTFDDFGIRMEQFGQRIRQLMKSRATALAA